MSDLTLRLIPRADDSPLPGNVDEALERLREGNAACAALTVPGAVVPPVLVSIGEPGTTPAQRPFAVVLGCADARAPVELVFHLASNELFVVRVAGNVPGSECIGSFEYAVANLATVKLAVVLGHSACGAVGAAVDAYLDHRNYPASAPLRSVVDKILPSVRTASRALRHEYGNEIEGSEVYRGRLVEDGVTLNAALGAMTLRDEVELPTVYGVFDLATRRVDLVEAPVDADAFLDLAARLAKRRIEEARG